MNQAPETERSMLVQATPEMVSIAGKLIHLTMGKMADHLLGNDNATAAQSILGQLFSVRANLFSHEFTEAAIITGRAVGLVVSYPASVIRSLEMNTAHSLLQAGGIMALARMIVRSHALWGVKEAEDDEYFVAHLAVLPAYEGRGIGRQLLEYAEANAQRHGYKKIALTVEVGNERAISLYRRGGFQVVGTETFEALHKRIGYNGFHRMRKYL